MWHLPLTRVVALEHFFSYITIFHQDFDFTNRLHTNLYFQNTFLLLHKNYIADLNIKKKTEK